MDEIGSEKKISSGVYILVIILAMGTIAFFTLNNGNKLERVDISINSEDIIIGNANAKITIVEYTDFSCPFCAAANGYNQDAINYLRNNVDENWEAPVPNIITNYVSAGKVRIVFRYFPGHGAGQEAHRVGWCMYEQIPEKFEEYSNAVFANQANANDILSMSEIAFTLGADKEEINKCLADKRYESRFNSEMLSGTALGVKGTPIFFINGIKIEGAQDYSEFATLIESNL